MAAVMAGAARRLSASLPSTPTTRKAQWVAIEQAEERLHFPASSPPSPRLRQRPLFASWPSPTTRKFLLLPQEVSMELTAQPPSPARVAEVATEEEEQEEDNQGEQ